jgi:hypothetical protein
MLRIKVTIQVEYNDETEINHTARINMDILIHVIFDIKYCDWHSPTSKTTHRIVVKMISECEKCTSVSQPFFFLNENGANPNNLDT